jgi:branched-chain amino acid transport system permease protein
MIPQLHLWHETVGLSLANAFAAIMLTGVITGSIVAAFLGLLVGLPTLRLQGDYLAIATLGFGEILGEIIRNIDYLGSTKGISIAGDRILWLGNEPKPLPPLYAEIEAYMGSTSRHVSFFWIFLGVVIAVAVVRNVKFSTSGRAIFALREDCIASESVGVPTTRYKVASFVIGAALAGMAGGFFSHKELLDSDSFRFTRSIMIVAMVILGGGGSISGSIAAAIVLTVIPMQLLAWNLEKSRLVIFALVIIFAMLFRPQGFFGHYEITDIIGWGWRKFRPKVVRDRAMAVELPPGPATLAAEGEDLVAVPPLLEVTGVTMQFGGLRAVEDFNLMLLPGELVGLIGPNGAGKTTVFNVLTGVYCPTRGTIKVNQGKRMREICGRKPHAISRLGIARTFQNIRLFANLSVLDNVQIAQHAHHKQGIPAAILRTPAFFREEELSRQRALGYLSLFNLEHLANERAGGLSYGDQRRLEIARALATRPRLLLLDEPAAGMNPTEKRELMEMIRSLRPRFGLTVLLIEHDMKVIMGVCQRIVVLDYGKTIATGTPEEIRKNPAVIQAYLGA